MKIVFMGTPKAAVPSLERLIRDNHEVAVVYTQPDRPSGRGNKITFSPVKEFALTHDLPVLQPSKIKTPEALNTFQSHRADAAIVVAYGRILPESFLQAFPKGAINLHFSMLPKYRGAAPVNWAIVKGEKATGVTTMQMDAGLDTGAVLLQRETAIGDEENAIDLMERLAIIGADLLSETLASYDKLTPQLQNDGDASFAPIMKKEDGLIDWTLDASSIANRVRGFQSFPTAFTFYKGLRLTIWNAEPVEGVDADDRKPGEIVEAKGDSLFIACADSVLSIKELQLEGKRRMNIRDFLNGVKPVAGENAFITNCLT